MLYLTFDVFDQAILLAKVHGEGAVAVLPAFETREIGLAFQPMAAAGLDFLNVLGNCQGSRQSSQNVNVVVHAAAKEGLIPQRTARKAVRKVIASLELAYRAAPPS